MKELEKALDKIIEKEVKKQGAIKVATIRKMVRREIEKELSARANILVHAVQEAVNSQIDTKLAHQEIIFLPEPEGYPKHAGETWTAEEDCILRDEVSAAIAQISHRHERTRHAIYCRMRDKIFTAQGC